jgi:hypothetical protein
MSSRKNLSRTIGKNKAAYAEEGVEFVGFIASCYGTAKTIKPPGQQYVSLASREFWQRVGAGKLDFDVRVGEVCALLCATFRTEVTDVLVPSSLDQLTAAAQSQIGDSTAKSIT